MTSRDFCFWLQGFFELGSAGDLPATGPESLTASQTAQVKAHLALVFKHEIDPSCGAPDVQAELQRIHDAGKTAQPGHAVPRPDGAVFRC